MKCSVSPNSNSQSLSDNLRSGRLWGASGTFEERGLWVFQCRSRDALGRGWGIACLLIMCGGALASNASATIKKKESCASFSEIN